MSWFSTKPRVKAVDPEQARQRQDARLAALVDVREAHELREGRISGARHIPLGRLHDHLRELLQEPEVIFVCRSGNRSASAAAALTRAGHSDAYNLTGGMIAWRQNGLPVQR